MAISNKDLVNNMGWQYLQRFSSQIVTFLVSLVLARLLSPEDYGTVALVQVVVVFFDAFSSRGFNQALIQKKDVDSLDYSTVFWFNLGINTLFYIGLFVAAPYIAVFYNTPSISLMLRVLSVRLLINSVNSIQQAFIQKNMQFKRLFLPTIIGTVTSAVTGISLAYAGAGAWALVVQSLVASAVNLLVMFFTVKWYPRFAFSFTRLKGMSRYGINMLLISLAESVYNELRALVIGKLYSTSDLAFHDKGKNLPSLVMTNLQNSVSTVFFSALVHESSRDDMLKKCRENLNSMYFLLAPVLVGLASVSVPLLTVLYTEKWVSAAPYMVLYCLTFLTWVPQTPALQAINAAGKADVTLKLTLAQCFLGLALLFAMMSFGPVAVAASVFVGNVISTIVIMVVFGKMFGYTLKSFLQDTGITTVQVCLMALAVYFAGKLTDNAFLQLLIQTLVGAGSYMLFGELFRNKAYKSAKKTVFSKIRRKGEGN